MIRGNFNGVMVLFMKGILLKIILMGKVLIYGKIKEDLMVIGLIIKWKGKVLLNGLMGEFIMENIKMIRKKVMGNFHGMMEGYIKVIGRMGNKMGKGNFIILNIMNGKKGFGKMVKGLNGLKMEIKVLGNL